MASPTNLNLPDRPTVSIVSERGPLAKLLYQSFLSQSVSVNIFAINIAAQNATIAGLGGVVHRLTSSAVKDNSGSRIVFISDLLNPAISWKSAVENDKLALNALSAVDLSATRKLFVFPRTTSSECNAYLRELLQMKMFTNQKTLLVFVESLLDRSLLNNVHDPLYFSLNHLAQNTLPSTPKYVYPLTVNVVADFILKSLLSLSFADKTLSLLGKKKLVAKIAPANLVTTTLGQEFLYFATNESKTFSKQVSYEALVEMTRSYSKDKDNTPVKIEIVKVPKPKKLVKKKTKKVSYWWGLLLAFFFFVFITTAIAGVGLYIGLRTAISGNTALSQSSLAVSVASFEIGQKPWDVLAAIPFVGKGFLPIANSLELGQAAANLAIDYDLTVQAVTNLGQQVLATSAYDVSSASRAVNSRVAKFHRDLDFFIANATSTKITRGITSRFVDFHQLTQTKTKLSLFSELLSHIPNLLGEGTSKSYLLVYQDSRIPRPTGGLIVGFALIKLDSGKIAETAFMATSEADDLLNGLVEPPEDARRFLQINRWLLQDANWDTDFPQSASRIEWFIDKEIGVAVDGVVTIDNEALRLLIGDQKLDLPGSEVITADNFPEKLSGLSVTGEKTGFVLFKKVLETLFSTEEKSFNTLSLYKALEQKHIQIFLHDSAGQDLISKLNYSGEIAKQECLIVNCVDDFIGITQAVLPDSEIVNNVQIEQTYEIVVDQNVTNKKVAIKMKNTGTRNYKTLVKVVGGISANFKEVLVREPASQYSQSPTVQVLSGRTEAASVIEIMPNSEKTLVFDWQERNDLDLTSFGQHNLFLPKRPGSIADKSTVKVQFPSGVSLQSQYPALTGSAEVVYNTELAQDLVLRFSW